MANVWLFKKFGLSDNCWEDEIRKRKQHSHGRYLLLWEAVLKWSKKQQSWRVLAFICELQRSEQMKKLKVVNLTVVSFSFATFLIFEIRDLTVSLTNPPPPIILSHVCWEAIKSQLENPIKQHYLQSWDLNSIMKATDFILSC